MTLVDARGWSKRNCCRLASGELAVRPGLRRVLAPDSQRMFCGGFSILNQFTGETWSYVFDVTSSVSSNRDLRLRIYDEDWQIFQTFSLNRNVDPRVITHAVVEGEILICSPDFPTLFGLVGSGVILAVKVASDNPSTTAIDMPSGIVSSFGNRFAIADGVTLYFSDPLTPTGGDARTFVPQNANQRPAPIFGLHEGAGGALVCITRAGVFGLDSSAGAVGIVGSNGTAWRMLNHAESYSFCSSAVVNGRVYALSRKGYKLVDVENDTDEVLNDPMVPFTYGARIASDDWRTARMFSGDDGPYVSITGACSAHDLDEKIRSWWSCNVGSTFNVRGVLKTPDGDDMLLAEDGIYEVVQEGNFDGDTTSTPAGTQPKGFLAGRVLTGPADNFTARDVTATASVGGTSGGVVYIAVRGDAPTPAVVPADIRGLVEGSSSWGASGRIYEPAPLQVQRAQFDLNSRDVSVEYGADFPSTRLGEGVDVVPSESAKKRPVERGP